MKKIDIQVNGGSGLLFNDISSLNQFLKIELNHLKYGECFIVPTFITDSFEKMQNDPECRRPRRWRRWTLDSPTTNGRSLAVLTGNRIVIGRLIVNEIFIILIG